MEIEILEHTVIDENIQNQVEELFNQLNSNIKQRKVQEILEVGNNTVLVVCREEGTLVGIATMVTYKVISGHKGMIEDVVVDTDQRGKGIGRKLMERLVEEARKMALDEILLFSGHHRTAAINLYKSLGFVLKDSGLYRLLLE